MIVDAVRQDMMRNLDVYKLGISLIKDNIHMVDSVVDAEIKDYLKELFRNCFIFLRNFVERNITNQIVLSEYLVTFLVHIETDLGQVSLINEIFRNNKKICLEKPGMLTDDFINLIVANGRQVKYLEFFLIIQRVNKEYIQSNQKAVLNIFMDPRNKQHIFALKDRHHSSHHHESKANPQAMTVKHEFDFEPQVQLDNANYLDEPYLYHAKLLEVLYNCAIGKEGML
jgi:inositol 1,4,5-triphosphate receptor type 1/inositol 1,4,5-triphosphate receptor type 3